MVTVTPATIGGRFTNAQSWAGQPVITVQDGGRIRTGGWTGSAAPVTVNANFTDDGSAATPTGTWDQVYLSEGRKRSTWQSPPFVTYDTDFTIGTLEPRDGGTGYFTSGLPFSSPDFAGTMAYYDNAYSGEAGPDASWVRDPGNWGVTSSNPAPGSGDTGSVKTYPANQFNLTTPTPVSSFTQILSYAACANPLLPASAYPLVDYEAAWDIFGRAHFGQPGITLEVMFWTRNHNQGPNIGVLAETGIDLNGDGKLWDLYMTVSTAADGGVSAQYSYGIWYLQDAYQEESGWVNILAGLRYFLMHYVIPDGTGAPASPLGCPLTQITRGWEICSTNYQPLEFRHLDYRLLMS